MLRRRMKCAIAVPLILVFGLLAAHPQRLAAAAPGDADGLLRLCLLESLPEDIRGSLQRHFSDWKIQEPAELSRSAHDRWAAEQPTSCPGIAAGHFLNGKDTAYALLLIPTDRTDPESVLVVFTQAAIKGIYAYKIVERLAAGGSDTFILTTPIAKYLQAESLRKSQLRQPESILLVTAGAKTEAFVYYWEKDSYQSQPVDY